MINETVERLNKPQPKFFKKLGNIFMTIGAVGAILTTTIATGGVALPIWIGATITGLGAVGKVLSNLPNENE